VSTPSPPAVFRFDVRLNGRTVVALRGIKATSGGIDVETETYPIGHPPDEPPLCRTFPFPTAEKARRFTDDVLTTLEYQNCEVNEHPRDA
jgi:hypothetical protein